MILAIRSFSVKLAGALNQGISALVLIPVVTLAAAYLMIRKKYRISEAEYDRIISKVEVRKNTIYMLPFLRKAFLLKRTALPKMRMDQSFGSMPLQKKRLEEASGLRPIPFRQGSLHLP